MKKRIKLKIKPKNNDRILWTWLCKQLGMAPELSTVSGIENYIRLLKAKNPTSAKQKGPNLPDDCKAYINDDGKCFVWDDDEAQYVPLMAVQMADTVFRMNGLSVHGATIVGTKTGRMSGTVPNPQKLPIQKFAGKKSKVVPSDDDDMTLEEYAKKYPDDVKVETVEADPREDDEGDPF